MRARFARFGGRTSANPVLEPILRSLKLTHPKADTSVIERAYVVAERCHRGQLRKSGDPYITHPLAVSTILADLGMPPSTIAASLLHDTVEDTDYSLDELRREFGDEIARLVDGVTKLDKVHYGDAAQAETVRKMVVAMARDIRVLVIKLADRLHNARTWRYVSASSAQRKARETLEIYAPLAHRLGMNTIKWELEDLSFATLYPKVYDEIENLVAGRAPAREEYLAGVRELVLHDLAQARIKATVTGRPKHYYSVYQKMIVRGKEFDEIFDLVGVRVLVESVRDCYAALGAMHARWTPVPGRFKDYIATPKFNMYQSLHTTVIGPQGKAVELQIRTYAMHRRAEFGVAAHWKYKEESLAAVGGKASFGGPGGNEMMWLRELVDWQSETEDSTDFLDSLRFEMQNAGVYAYTPRGDLIQLPAKATPVDFAYGVHTEVGHTCVGARVNGRLVSLESELESGDVVEIFTSKSPTAGPSRDWLDFVKSPRARNKIRQWFTKERREEAIDHGKDLIAKQMRKEGLPMHRLFRQANLDTVAKDLGHPDIASLYAAVGENNVGAQNVVERVIDLAGGREGAEEELAEATAMPPSRMRRSQSGSRSDAGVEVVGVSGDVMVKLARCCTPVPGDPIKGFVTRGSGISVHRADCANFAELADMTERVVEVRWIANAKTTFLVAMQVEALDRPHLLSDITKVISDQHVNILSATLSTGRDRVAKSRFTFEMADAKHLGSVLKAVGGVQGVFDAYRVTQ
nr:bifunctional (p)ppGpp synthetase/guanosine-3',5'-bis(diphosphate) 3'-pyrophosphohydrolase [Arsenicicoccus sp. UBA2120]